MYIYVHIYGKYVLKNTNRYLVSTFMYQFCIVLPYAQIMIFFLFY